MSDEREQEFGEEDFGGGEEVSEEMEQEREEEKDNDDEVSSDKEFGSENEVGDGEGEGEGEEIGAETEVREREEFGGEGESYSVENDGETMSVSSSNKRIKETSIDRLSALPDSILIRILSFLETQDAANTATLSKRWQYLWTELPRLEFYEINGYSEEQIRDFVTKFHRSLVIRSGKNLEKFEVHFDYSECFTSDLNVWVEFVVRNKVKEVGLVLSSWTGLYPLPQMMYSHSSLKWLSLGGCSIAPERTIEWRSLTTLLLEKVEIREHVLEKIFSSCPVLSYLRLMACPALNRLEINSRSLYSITVHDWEKDGNKPLLEISAPYVRFLDIWHPIATQLRLRNIPSVVAVKFDFDWFEWGINTEELMSYTRDLFEDLRHVKKLELGHRCIEVLSMLAVNNGWKLPKSGREYLIVEARRDEKSISGIVALLESSPNLETLVIRDNVAFSENIKTWCPPVRGDLDCDLLHLKTINFMNFAKQKLAGEPLLTLAQILLKRAIALEKMVIKEYGFSSGRASSYFIKITQALLNYPKSSQKAVVLIH